LGVRLGGGASQAGGLPLATGSNISASVGSSYTDGASGANLNSFVNLPASGQNGFNPASIAVSIFGEGAGRFLNLELSALEADGKGKVVSSPRVVTADQAKALIEQGTELPYQVATSSGATSIAFRKANLSLAVTPHITPEGNVILDLDINKDTVGQATAAGFAIDTKHIKTQVLVENGGTVVIGGIFTLDEVDNETRVPVLGEIPVFGNLFKNKSRTSTKREMLVFITPKMISDRVGIR
jgi:type IV pilus assembly protein PilQ